ncbi:MAG: S9 family peptidase [Ignavibacteriae bacterium]|nr:MAG: S9 family peptidase [Ignavibacteriota bacterium]
MTLNFEVKKIPLRDFFKNPDKINYKISLDGKYLSYLAPWENRLNIFVQQIGSDVSTRVTSEKDRDIAGYFWGSNDRILYLKDKNGDENFHLYAVDKDGGNLIDLTPFDNVTTHIIDELEEIEEEVLIGLNKRNPEIFDVYRLNIITGKMDMAAENPGNISSWLTDHNGKIRIAITTDGVNSSLLYREDEEHPFKNILTTSFKETLSPLFFTFDNKNFYAASNINRDKSAIVKIDPQTGKEIELIYEHSEVDVSDLDYSKKRKVLTAIGFITWKRELVYLDDEAKSIYERIKKEINGNFEIIISDENKDEDKFLVRSYSDRSLGSYYFYNKNTDEVLKLADIGSWLKEKELAYTKPITYKSCDGLTIHGYLTLPNISEHKNLPVVVNVHGGPWARDIWGYDPEVQFLANRGYAILQINFRGSTGYGKKFWEASFKKWGKEMQSDISDGVKWLIEQGIADQKRIAIYGGSYGGYATLAGLAFTPELYACGVDYVGVSNLFTFMKTIPPYWKPFLDMMYEMVGNPDKDIELLKEASPVFHVDKIKAPLFIAQGRMDPRVNVNESDQMVEALKNRGIEVPYMVKDNEGHGFRNEENRFEFYEEMEKFLERHLK